jgi:hypothetical protein
LAQFASINSTPIGNATPSTGVFTTATAGAVSSGFIGNTGTAFTGASINLSGNVLANGAVVNTLTVNGTAQVITLNATTLTATGNVIGGLAQFAALNATPIGNATPSTGVFTTATAGSVSSGFIGNTGTVFTGASLNVTGNVLAAGAVLNDLTVNSGITSTGFINTTANISAAVVNGGAINSTGFITDRTNPLREIIDAQPIIAGVSMEQQMSTVKKNVAINEAAAGVDIGKMAIAPMGYNTYLTLAIKDASFYAPRDIYPRQNNVDNARALRQMSSDRLHQEMINQQYRGR